VTVMAYVIGALLRFLFTILGLAAALAVHERMLAFVVFLLLAVLVVFWRLVLTRPGQGWRRVRSIRFRLWLWLRPGRGFASLPELWLRWGRLAAVSYGARSRPGLSLRAQAHRADRRVCRAARPGAVRTPPVRRLRPAPAGPGPAAHRQDRARRLDHPAPGAGADHQHPRRPAPAHQLTSPSCRGPVYVFNPEGVGGIPSTFAWDLLGVCAGDLMAFKMAGWLAGDTPGYGDLSWFEEQDTMGMSGLLLAAATTGCR
jgi:hypothetical protein